MRYLYALIVGTGLCLAPSIGQAAPASTASQNTVSVAAPVQPSSNKEASVASKSRADVAKDKARYADREAQSGEAQEYRGGDTLVIGASAVTVILVILLVIVLI